MFKAKAVGTEKKETVQQSESLYSIAHADSQDPSGGKDRQEGKNGFSSCLSVPLVFLLVYLCLQMGLGLFQLGIQCVQLGSPV